MHTSATPRCEMDANNRQWRWGRCKCFGTLLRVLTRIESVACKRYAFGAPKASGLAPATCTLEGPYASVRDPMVATGITYQPQLRAFLVQATVS